MSFLPTQCRKNHSRVFAWGPKPEVDGKLAPPLEQSANGKVYGAERFSRPAVELHTVM